MGSLGYFSAIPGAAVPGMAQPARDQQFSYPLYLYAGTWALFYLDYLDALTGHTLAVVPGGYYSMTVVNSRAGLTVPPSDGRWDIGAGAQFRVVRTRPPSPAEVRAARERALAAHGHYPGSGCRTCNPVLEEPPMAVRVAGPDFAPQPSIAQVRADLERSRLAHGHYAPGGCRQCLGGDMQKDDEVVV